MKRSVCLSGLPEGVKKAIEYAVDEGWRPVKTRRHIMLYGPNRKGLVLVSISTKEPNIYKKILGDIRREGSKP